MTEKKSKDECVVCGKKCKDQKGFCSFECCMKFLKDADGKSKN